MVLESTAHRLYKDFLKKDENSHLIIIPNASLKPIFEGVRFEPSNQTRKSILIIIPYLIDIILTALGSEVNWRKVTNVIFIF